MTFEQASVEQRLKKLHQLQQNLQEIAAVSRDQFVADYRQYWLAERGLQLAAEAVLDIAHHILAAVFGRFPETNEAALDGLRDCQVISAKWHSQLKGFGGLRNVLVHGYLDIDETQIYEHAQKAPEVLRGFSREIVAWMDQRKDQRGGG